MKLDQQLDSLSWSVERRFGVEAELNAFDGKNRPKDAKMPEGIVEVGNMLVSLTEKKVDVTRWMHTHNNDSYVVKPDSSCGMEVCTPVLKGWDGLRQTCKMIQAFSQEKKFKSDERCSFHVHVNVYDCSLTEVVNIISNWIKCELVFADSMPTRRKRSRYCQLIGISDLFDLEYDDDLTHMVNKMAQSKYFTFNDYHYVGNGGERRLTVEFRLADNDACLDPFYAKNWVRLVVHFVDMAKKRDFKPVFIEGDPKTGLAWLDPVDVFELLGFMPGQYNLSDGLKQTRNWFLARICKNIFAGDETLGGIWSKKMRVPAMNQINYIIERIKEVDGYTISEDDLSPSNIEEALYSKQYRI